MRQQVEQQLAIQLDKSHKMNIDRYLEDMALIGRDFFFRDGAALGVLFCAKSDRELAAAISRQRQDTLRSNAGVTEQLLTIGAHRVSLLSTADHRVRSFYAHDDRFHLITNCRAMMVEFLAASRGEGSLAARGNSSMPGRTSRPRPPSARSSTFPTRSFASWPVLNIGRK